MGFDVFLQGFARGDAAPGDGQAVLAVLGPYVSHRDEQGANVETADGDAEVYGLGDPESGLMFTHTSGRAVWDLLYEVAVAAGFVIIPVGCPTCVVDQAAIDHLPDELRDDAVLVRSGAELLAVAAPGLAEHQRHVEQILTAPLPAPPRLRRWWRR